MKSFKKLLEIKNFMMFLNQVIGLMSRVFTNGLGD